MKNQVKDLLNYLTMCNGKLMMETAVNEYGEIAIFAIQDMGLIKIANNEYGPKSVFITAAGKAEHNRF